jgi:BolA family transcriptional regulator, general stress-responsive regulator
MFAMHSEDTSAMPTPTAVETAIREHLMVALEPQRLDVINESHLHAGHRSSPGTGDSHFRLQIVSAKFAGLTRVARQRLVNQALAALIGKPIHALAMETLAPGEQPRA